MDSLFYITSLVFAGVVVRNILLWISFFEEHNYHFDKIILSFKSNTRLQEFIFSAQSAIKVCGFVLYFLSIYFYSIVDYYPYVVFAVFFICILLNIATIQADKRKIVFSKSTISFFIAIIATDFFLYSFPLFDRFFWLLIVEKLSVFFLFFYLVIFSLLSDFYRDIRINRATHKIAQNKHIISVVIIGSYNKTLTKEYMAAILSMKKCVITTERNHTSLIDIANLILDQVTAKTDILIAEIPTYKKGQIHEIASLLQPTIGIFTGIDEKSSLFYGKKNNLVSSELELVESIPSHGSLFFNGNNEFTCALSSQTLKKKMLYYVGSPKKIPKASIRAAYIRAGDFSTTCTFFVNNKVIGKYRVNVIGRSTIEALLPGIALALTLRMKKADIRRRLEKLSPISCMLQPYLSPRKVIYINNTRSTSYASMNGAIESIERYKKKRVAIIMPLENIGHEASEVHYRIGLMLGITFNTIFVTNKNYFAILRKGVSESGGTSEIVYNSPAKIADKIKKLHAKDMVLFEGREAQEVFDLLDSQPVY